MCGAVDRNDVKMSAALTFWMVDDCFVWGWRTSDAEIGGRFARNARPDLQTFRRQTVWDCCTNDAKTSAALVFWRVGGRFV